MTDMDELKRRLERAPLNGGVRLNVEEALALAGALEAKELSGPAETKHVPRPSVTMGIRARRLRKGTVT